MKQITTAAIIAATLALGGCAVPTHYVNSSNVEAPRKVTIACNLQANNLAPPNVTAIDNSSSRLAVALGNSFQSPMHQAELPPASIITDINTGLRDQILDECMNAQGYVLTEVKGNK